MITSTIRNCIGIAVEITSTDTEQEVSKLVGIKSYFHIRFNKAPNTYQVRKRECFCVSCMNGKYGSCTYRIDNFKHANAVVLGNRQAPGRESIINEKQKASETEEFVVEKIKGTRQHHGKIQYLVKWAGYGDEDNSWLDVDRLNCPVLISEFNLQSNSQ